MSNETNFLFGGFLDDVTRALDEIGLSADSVAILTDDSPDDADLPNGAFVVYVFGPYTHSSSRLLGDFLYVHDHLAPREQYLLDIDDSADLDVRERAFHGMKYLPVITLQELKKIIDNWE